MSKDLKSPQEGEEVDLGQLFKALGNAFERFFNFIGSLFYKLFLVFVWIVFFIKKHVVKIIIAGAIGFSYGFFKQNKGEPIYKSTILIKQNYDTGENLYNLISYYNELIREGDSVITGRSLGLNPSKAASLICLEIEPALTDNEKLEKYNIYIKSLDSIPDETLDFQTYLDNLMDYQNKKQRIIIKSEEKDVFIPVINRIVNEIERIDFFVTEQKKDLDELESLEKSILESLEASKELQMVYKDVLVTPLDNSTGSQTSIRIDNTEDKSKTKEYELYQSDIELRRELVDIQRQKSNIKNIIEVVSSQENQGTVDNYREFLGKMLETKKYYALILILFSLVVLLGLRFTIFLEKYKYKI